MINSQNLILGLDTDILAEKALLSLLRASSAQMYLSSIVLTEQAIWLLRLAWSLDKIARTPDFLSAEEIPFSSTIGLLVAEICAKNDIKFNQHARDVMIGVSYLYKRGLLLTNNKKHYRWVNRDVLKTLGFPSDWQNKKWVYNAQEVLNQLRKTRKS